MKKLHLATPIIAGSPLTVAELKGIIAGGRSSKVCKCSYNNAEYAIGAQTQQECEMACSNMAHKGPDLYRWCATFDYTHCDE